MLRFAVHGGPIGSPPPFASAPPPSGPQDGNPASRLRHRVGDHPRVYLFATTTLVQAYVIPTGSMEGTLRVGDHMLVDRVTYCQPGSLGAHMLPYRESEARRHRGLPLSRRYPPDLRQARHRPSGDRIRLENKQVIRNGGRSSNPTRSISPSTPMPIATISRARRDATPLRGAATCSSTTSSTARWLFPRNALRARRQPRKLRRQPLLGLRAAQLRRGQAAVGLLVVRRAHRGPEEWILSHVVDVAEHSSPGRVGPHIPRPALPGGQEAEARDEARRLAAFGWLVPGGAYLLTRRYGNSPSSPSWSAATFAAGLALHGAFQWPQSGELRAWTASRRSYSRPGGRQGVGRRPIPAGRLAGAPASSRGASTSTEPPCFCWPASST